MPHDAAVSAAVTAPAARSGNELARGVRAGVVAYVGWGLLTIYWKAINGFDAIELIGWRVLTAAGVMAVIVTMRRSWASVLATLRAPRTLPVVVAAAVLLAINWLVYVLAVVNEHILEVALGYFMAPLGTMMIGLLVLGEARSRLQYLALALAAAAVVVLTVSYGQVPYAAAVIAVSWSLYGLVKRRLQLPAAEGFAAESFVLALPAAITVLVMASRPGSVPDAAGGVELVLVLGTGLITALPLMLFAVAAARVPFTLLGPIQYIVPTINLILGWAVYHEAMPVSRLAGFAFVWLALIIVAVDQLRRHARRPST